MIAPQSLEGPAQSLCDWTLDAPPVFREIRVTVQASAPSGLAGGNGSATFAAKDAYRQELQQKIRPPRRTGLPKAVISTVSGLGESAFAALQVVNARGDRTDLVTVMTRERNVTVTVLMQGLAKSANGKYGPASVPLLRAGAIAVARDVLSRLR
jgi:hypothetical protein